MCESILKVKHDDKLKITIAHESEKEIQKNKFYFRPIGKYVFGDEQMDALHEISKFNKAELFLLNEVNSKLIAKANLVKLKKTDYSLANQRKLTSAIKLWISKNLIVRIRREEYMINPNFFTPEKGTHESIEHCWKHHNNL